jgi:hypothetical protein
MAVRIKEGTFTETQGEIIITNGDFMALKKIVKDYKISDVTNVIAFAIGVLDQANGTPIMIEKTDGSIIKFKPSEELLESNS